MCLYVLPIGYMFLPFVSVTVCLNALYISLCLLLSIAVCVQVTNAYITVFRLLCVYFLMSSLASPFVSICMKCETNYTKGMNINQIGTSTMQATLKHQLIRSKLYL